MKPYREYTLPSIEAMHQQLQAATALTADDRIWQINRAERILQAADKHKVSRHSVCNDPAYSILAIENEPYLLMNGNLFDAAKFEGRFRGKLAVNREGELFFLKSVTVLNFREGMDGYFETNQEVIEQLISTCTQEIQHAHQLGNAPHNTLLVRKTEKNTKLYMMLKFGGYALSALIHQADNAHFRIQLKPIQGVEIAIQLLQRVLELHRQGYVHRDIKLANSLVNFKENGTMEVSLTDFEHLTQLTHSFSDGQRYYVETNALPSSMSKRHLLPAYRQPLTDFFCGIATDLYAAMVASEEIIQHLPMAQRSSSEQRLYQQFKTLIATTKQMIEASSTSGPHNGHPKVSNESIEQLENRLTNMLGHLELKHFDENQLQQAMDKQQYLAHGFRKANHIHCTIFSQASIDSEATWDDCCALFVAKLENDVSYQAIWQAFVSRFPDEQALLSINTLQHLSLTDLIAKEKSAIDAFNSTHLIFSLLTLYYTLDDIKIQFSKKDAGVLDDVIQKIRVELGKSQNELRIDSRVFSQRAANFLEENQCTADLKTIEVWHTRIYAFKKKIESFYVPMELTRAAACIVHIYNRYLQTSEMALPSFNTYQACLAYFEQPSQYRVCEKIYLDFIQRREAYENYYTTHNISYQKVKNDVLFEEWIFRLYQVNKDVGFLSRLFNDTLVDEVLLPHFYITAFTQQSLPMGQAREHLYRTSAKFLAKIAGEVGSQFFNNPQLFTTFFQRLRHNRSDEAYFNFFAPFFYQEIPVLSSASLTRRIHIHEEIIKLYLTMMVFQQPLGNKIFETLDSDKKRLASIFLFHQFANSKQSLFTQLVQQLEAKITVESSSVLTAREILDAFCKKSHYESGDSIQREQAVYHEYREAFMRANIRDASIMRQIFPAYRQDPTACEEDDCFELVTGGVFQNSKLKDAQQAFLSKHWKAVYRIAQKLGQETLFFSWLTQTWHHEIEQLHGKWESLNNTACYHRMFHKSPLSLK